MQSPRRQSGVVIVITLLAMLLLAAVVMYVINMGRQVNERVATQTAADADVKAGATWVARSYNTVAMNNIAMTRYIAAINTLDGTPDVTKAALDEQTALRDALQARLGSVNTGNAALTAVVRNQFSLLLGQLNNEVGRLAPVDQVFQGGFDMRTITHYNGPTGRGQMWLAMQSLDEFNQATMDSLGILAQMSADQAGRVNLQQRADNAAAMMLPLEPRTPWVRGHFHDFERPVKQGLLPGADDTGAIQSDSVTIGFGQVDDKEFNRGPYDAVYGWRDYRRQGFVPTGPPQGGGVGGTNTGGVTPPFGGPGDNSPSTPGYSPIVGYYTWGTHGHAVRQMHGYATAESGLIESRFQYWFGQQAGAKLGYLWDGLTARSMAMPLWDHGYPSDVPADPATALPFSETAMFTYAIKSTRSISQSGFMSTGTWTPDNVRDNSRSYYARIQRHGGWWLPNMTNAFGGSIRMIDPLDLSTTNPGTNVVVAGTDTWMISFPYTVYYDADLGLAPQFDINGNPIPYQLYYYRVVTFAGVNRHLVRAGVFDPTTVLNPGSAPDTRVVENPYDGFDPNAPTAPAPMDFDHSLVPHDNAAVRRDLLTFLGIARRDDHATTWPSAFAGGKPDSHIVSLAQASVFNDHSWDLWTPMWHAQLQPVTGFDSWVTLMESSDPGTLTVPVVDVNAYFDLTKYLRSMDQLGPLMLEH